MPIIFVTGHGDVSMAVRAMKAGAVEFFTKPCRSDVLLNSLRHAIERSQASMRREAQVRAIQDRYATLTCREREVTALVVCGRLNKQVGGELGISEITVKPHRGRVMQKMNAASFADLINMAAALLPGTNPDRLILSEWSGQAQQTHFGNSQLGTVFAIPSVSQAATR